MDSLSDMTKDKTKRNGKILYKTSAQDTETNSENSTKKKKRKNGGIKDVVVCRYTFLVTLFPLAISVSSLLFIIREKTD